MNNDDLVLRALETAQIDFDKDNWDPVKSFAENGIDSLDFMRLVMAIGELCGVKITDAEISDLQTPNDLIALLVERGPVS